ncbi:glycosyltransferase [Acidianus manzaensis]|uniref:Glycosyl transferase family 2 n=1 Tax=Acidianus manzaensis TaxID=282676 RepID=A0A1W6K3L3_9CREN|nr:glycosyltransferase family 2 protein [Acidianus manzaensis]ARM77024.1 glycosyl transferase family 2 [Acidianus manzaensis]
MLANIIIYVIDFISILLDLGLIFQIYQENKKFFIEPKGNFSGKVSVIIPVRGIDINIEENIESILDQEFTPYEVIYVIDPDDPNKRELIQILKKFNVKVIESYYQCDKCSGKIKAQISGLLQSKGDIIVFGDSDTFYHKKWLKELIAPLSMYTATTTFSFAHPIKLSLSNLIRAGFWTLGFESQALQGTFLWGGSMAFRRDFLDNNVITELSKEWCDDCTLTRIVKERNGTIGFIGKAVPLNIYDEHSLVKWASRQVLTVKIYSYRGAKAFLVIGFIMLLLFIIAIINLNVILFIPFILWIVKNLNRGKYLGKNAILPSLMSILGIFFAWFILVISWNRNKITWRDKIYVIK